jgi:hypothetical protein
MDTFKEFLATGQRRSSAVRAMVHGGNGKETVIVNVTGLDKAYAVVRVGDGEPERTYILDKEQFNELSTADHALAKADSSLPQFGLPVLKVGRIATAEDESPPMTLNDPPNSVENAKPSTPEEENKLQTQGEAFFSLDKGMTKRIRDMFSTKDFCAKNPAALEIPKAIKFKHPVLGELERPSQSRTFICLGKTGDVLLAQSIDYFYYDLAFVGAKPGGKMVICTYESNVASTQELFVKKVQESSKIGFDIGFSITPQAPALNLDAAEGTPVMENGKEKIDPATNQPIKFNLDYQRQYYELTVRAIARYKLIHRLQKPPVIVPLD